MQPPEPGFGEPLGSKVGVEKRQRGATDRAFQASREYESDGAAERQKFSVWVRETTRPRPDQ